MQSSHVINIQYDKLIVATSFFQKLRGLYFRHEDTYIFIWACKKIHTLFFRQNIDVAFLSTDLVVLKSVRNLSPWKFLNCKNSRIVVERFSKKDEPWFEVGEVIDV